MEIYLQSIVVTAYNNSLLQRTLQKVSETKNPTQCFHKVCFISLLRSLKWKALPNEHFLSMKQWSRATCSYKQTKRKEKMSRKSNVNPSCIHPFWLWSCSFTRQLQQNHPFPSSSVCQVVCHLKDYFYAQIYLLTAQSLFITMFWLIW